MCSVSFLKWSERERVCVDHVRTWITFSLSFFFVDEYQQRALKEFLFSWSRSNEMRGSFAGFVAMMIAGYVCLISPASP